MALTVTIDQQAMIGDLRLRVLKVTFDSSYPTGGEALTADDMAVRGISSVLAEGQDGYVFQYDHANNKLLAYEAGADGAALDEVANATDLSGVSDMRVTVIGY